MPIIKQINIEGTVYDILDVASTTTEGKVSTTVQSFAGDKTFTDSLIAGGTLVGTTGTEATGNITTTVPTETGNNNQIMFMLDDNAVHNVSVTPAQTSGTAVGTIIIDGTSTVLYSPNSKPIQTAVSSPSASGTATQFITTISQNTNGVITATKANMPTHYVTAQGTSGSWYYRKWSDLTYECWRTISFTVNINTAWSNWYYGTCSDIAYPVTFTEKPIEVVRLGTTQDWWAVLSPNKNNTTSRTAGYVIMRPNSATSASHTMDYYVRGKVSS